MDLFLDLAMDNPGFPVVGAHSGATPIMGAFYKKNLCKNEKIVTLRGGGPLDPTMFSIQCLLK